MVSKKSEMSKPYFIKEHELGEPEQKEAARLWNLVASLELDSPEWVASIRRLTELRILTMPVALLLVHAASGDLNAEQTKEAESYGILGLFLQWRAEIQGDSGKA